MSRVIYQPAAAEPEKVTLISGREQLLFFGFGLAFVALFARFFYLQIVRGEDFEAQAQAQYQQTTKPYSGNRGKIFVSSDEYPLVTNRYIYQLSAQPDWTTDAAGFYDLVAPYISADPEASASLKARDEFVATVQQRREAESSSPVLLAKHVTQETMDQVDQVFNPSNFCNSAATPCLVADREIIRYYPEGDMAAHVIGFLSKDKNQGHYGIEGKLDRELAGKSVTTTRDAQVSGDASYVASNLLSQNLDGRDIYLTIDRQLQHLAEQTLEEGLATYGAERGEIIITQPSTGRILALATSPRYDPENYYAYDTSIYKNPSIVDYYEPGSTFKVITMAAAVDAGLVSPQTVCPVCASDLYINGYRIHNWDESHNAGVTMEGALEKSDNIALAWVSQLLGTERFQQYLEAFRFGQPLELETEEDADENFPTSWRPIEVANRAFGQGIAVTSLQLVQAVGAIANGGEMMKLHLVDQAYDKATDTYYPTAPQSLGQVISPETAQTMAAMMQKSAQHGEAQYIYKTTSQIAGKTGTAQIPVPGGYSDDTIASFIGFAPYDDPQFLMLIKYERPRTSSYAAETAAVTWKQLAEKLFIKFGIPTQEDD